MTIEEKARAYDNALQVLRKYDGANIMFSQSLKEEMFPELKESEDERIRKAMIDFFKHEREEGIAVLHYGVNIERMIAWLEKQGGKFQYWKPSEEQLEALDYAYNSCPDTERGNYYEGVLETIIDDLHKLSEKQGEQKPDKVEPKFKVGDWVVYDGWVCQIIDVTEDGYCNSERGFIPRGREDSMRLWTIQDAKNGDVLCCENGWTCIFKALDNHKNTYSSYCFMDSDKWFCNAGSECHTLNEQFIKAYNSELHPATKEQRDLLFQKMKEAGYVWDAEKKELRKIEQKPADKIEPKFKVGDKIQYLKGCGTIMTIEKIENGEYIFGNNLGHTTIEDGNKWYLVECNPTWSEKDEIGLCDALWCIKQASRIVKDENEMGNCWYAENWLKSLRPQNTWKPSEEQIHAFEQVYDWYNNNFAPSETLTSLYSDLKKLKGE